jgi:hypothetical protein
MDLWFKAKTYGYGWYPANWKGWIVIAVYLIALASFIRYCFSFGEDFNVWLYLSGVVALTAILIFICYKKGESARWRWGKKNEDDSKNSS